MLGFLQGQISLVCGNPTSLVKFAQFFSVATFSTPGLRRARKRKSFETLNNDPDFQPI